MMGTTPEPRRQGRPDARGSLALDRRILDIATRLFVEQGYAATSIEQIAAAAGAGKQTIYRRYASKEELFRAVISEQGRRLIAGASAAELGHADPLTALREACRTWLDLVAQPDVVALYRILVAEAYRFPALIDLVMGGVSGPFHDIILRLLRAARAAGRIHCPGDDVVTCRALSGLVTGWAMMQALLGQPGLSDDAERAAFFQGAWDIFLQGVVTS